MDNIMVDIETLSTASNASILSIGAVYFDAKLKRKGPTYYANVDTNTCKELGLDIDPETVLWWFKRDESARNAVMTKPQDIKKVLMEFRAYVRQGGANVKLWANGSNFDTVILDSAYKAAGLDTPWKFYNVRDVRTIVDLDNNRVKYEVKRTGTYHNALDDAITQADWMIKAINRLKSN